MASEYPEDRALIALRDASTAITQVAAQRDEAREEIARPRAALETASEFECEWDSAGHQPCTETTADRYGGWCRGCLGAALETAERRTDAVKRERNEAEEQVHRVIMDAEDRGTLDALIPILRGDHRRGDA